MKKFLFLGLAAMMAFTSCTKDETLAVAQNGAIGFDVSADKATRSVVDPSITTETIDNFAVYGWMEKYTGVVFNDELVTRSGETWGYTNTQYWVAGNDYYFAALAPSNGRNWELTVADSQEEANYGIGQVKFTNEAGKQDLLYWAEGPFTGKASGNAPVGIEFKHLLSKVKFSFVNEFDNESVTLKVSDVVINDLEKVANINLAVDKWWENANAWVAEGIETVDFNFGAASATAETTADAIAQYKEMESYNQLLVFPHEQRNYLVTFKVEMYLGTVLAGTYLHDVEVPVFFEMGKAYDLKATINSANIVDPQDPNHQGEQLEPIQFEVTVEPWIEAGEVEMPGLANVAEAAFLQAVADAPAGATVALTDNVVLSKELVVEKDLTIDLNGKTLATASNWTRSGDDTYSFPLMVSAGTLTIKGEGKIVAGDGDYSMAVWVRGGNLVVDGGDFYNGGETTDLIYVQTGNLTINGGKFVAAEKGAGEGTNNKRCALNCQDASYKAGTATIVVRGGTFFEFDPANNVSEGDNTNFVDADYQSVYDSATGYYTVVAK